MKLILGLIDNISEWVGKGSSYLILCIMGVMGYDILARLIFNTPTVWAYETLLFLFGAYSILGGVYTLRYRAHVSVDILHKALPLRIRATIDIITSVIFFCFCGVLLWKGGQMAWLSLKIREYSTFTTWEPPLYPVKMMIPLAALLLLLQGLTKFARDLVMAIKGRELK